MWYLLLLFPLLMCLAVTLRVGDVVIASRLLRQGGHWESSDLTLMLSAGTLRIVFASASYGKVGSKPENACHVPNEYQRATCASAISPSPPPPMTR